MRLLGQKHRLRRSGAREAMPGTATTLEDTGEKTNRE